MRGGGGGKFSACPNFFFAHCLCRNFFFQVNPSARICFATCEKVTIGPSFCMNFFYLLLCMNFFLGIFPCMNFFFPHLPPPITFLMVRPLRLRIRPCPHVSGYFWKRRFFSPFSKKYASTRSVFKSYSPVHTNTLNPGKYAGSLYWVCAVTNRACAVEETEAREIHFLAPSLFVSRRVAWVETCFIRLKLFQNVVKVWSKSHYQIKIKRQGEL